MCLALKQLESDTEEWFRVTRGYTGGSDGDAIYASRSPNSGRLDWASTTALNSTFYSNQLKLDCLGSVGYQLRTASTELASEAGAVMLGALVPIVYQV